MPFINYDGLMRQDDEALFNAHNQAFRAGEGLVETMLHTKNGIRLFDLHWRRLCRSLDCIAFPLLDEEYFRRQILNTLAANNHPDRAVVRVQFFMEGISNELHFTIELIPLPETSVQWPEQGITLGITQKAAKCHDVISHLKTTSRMAYQIAKRDAAYHKWDDALLLNEQGNVVESTHSNVFAVQGGKICTPSLHSGCIDGVMRKYLLQHNTTEGAAVVEQEITTEMLLHADEIFLTNAVRGIQPVHFFMNKKYGHSITRKIFERVALL